MTTADSSRDPGRILDRMLAAAARSGAPEYDVYLVQGQSLAIAAKNRRVDQVRRSEEFQASLRLIIDGRLGFAYTSIFTDDAVDRMVQEAAAAARLADPIPGLSLPDPPSAIPHVPGLEPDRTEQTLDQKLDAVLRLEAAALDADPRIERVRHAEYHESEYTVWLANHHGFRHSHDKAIFSAGVQAKAAEGTEAEMGYEGESSLRRADLNMEQIGRTAAGRAVQKLGGRQAASCSSCPVLIENRVTADFLDVLASSFLADVVQKGKSTLAGKVGQTIASANITLIDDGLRPGGLASASVDGEGAARQTTTLIGRGVMNGFLYDHPRAMVDGVRSTGNAGRSAKTSPGVATTNLYLAPGEASPDELGRQLGRGVLVTDVLGLHTANAVTGDFSLGIAGFWLENGAVDHPVKGMALAGNFFTMLSRVLAVGSDLRFFGSIGGVSLLVDGLVLAGR
jgi:PmbA protein